MRVFYQSNCTDEGIRVQLSCSIVSDPTIPRSELRELDYIFRLRDSRPTRKATQQLNRPTAFSYAAAKCLLGLIHCYRHAGAWVKGSWRWFVGAQAKVLGSHAEGSIGDPWCSIVRRGSTNNQQDAPPR